MFAYDLFMGFKVRMGYMEEYAPVPAYSLLRVDPIIKGLIHYRIRQDVMKVVSPSKNGGKSSVYPIHFNLNRTL